MFNEEIITYFESIEPSDELIERTVNMSRNKTNKKVKFSRRTIALLSAAIILLLGITGYAGVNKIFNDEKGIVSQQVIDGKEIGAFVFDFSKAETQAVTLSDADNEIIKEFNKHVYKDIVIPAYYLNNEYVVKSISPFITEDGKMITLVSNKKGCESVDFKLIPNLTKEEMNGFWGAGGEDSTCEVVNVNGMDVCITYDGAEEIGYSAFIVYANGDTMYEFNCGSSTNIDEVKEFAKQIVASLSQEY